MKTVKERNGVNPPTKKELASMIGFVLALFGVALTFRDMFMVYTVIFSFLFTLAITDKKNSPSMRIILGLCSCLLLISIKYL